MASRWSELLEELQSQGFELAEILSAASSGQQPEAKKDTDELTIFDNSMQGMPRSVSGLMRLAPEALVSEVYRLYLKAKFFFLAEVTLGASPSSAALRARFDDYLEQGSLVAVPDSTVEELVDGWSRVAAQETQVLVKRIDQLGIELVGNRWALDEPEFDAWRDAALAQTTLAAERTLDADGVVGALKRVPTALEDSELESAVRAIERSLWTVNVRGQLLVERGEASTFEYADSYLSTSALLFEESREAVGGGTDLGPVAAHLTHWLVDGARSGEVSWTAFCNELALRLAEHVHCRTADVLQVREDGRLGVIASSKAGVAVEELGDEKFYTSGEGITGSALLMSSANPRPWVGTNYLLSDPRVSPKHVEKYSEVYGDIRDYWVFPLFSGGDVIAAFRVVRRDDGHRIVGPPWPEHLLRELARFARWLEQVVEKCFPPGDRRTMVQRAGVEAAHRPAVRSLISELNLKFVEPAFLEVVVAHLCAVTAIKIEKLSIGCTLAVVADDRVRALAAGLDSYRSVPELGGSIGIDDARHYYNRVDPSHGVFVYGGSGSLHGVRQLPSSPGTSGFKACLQLSEDNARALLFFLDRDQDCVRIAMEGELVGDYFLSEVSGYWVYRSTLELGKTLKTAVVESGLSDGWDTVKRVFELVNDLSYGRVGSMIVVGEPDTTRVRMTGGDQPERLYLTGLDDHEFLDLARADGAIHIAWDGAILATGVMVRGNGPGPVREKVVEPGSRGGARHWSADEFAQDAGGSCVIFVISENRPITIYVAGERIVSKR